MSIHGHAWVHMDMPFHCALQWTCSLAVSGADEKKIKKAGSWLPAVLFFLRRFLVDQRPTNRSSCPYRLRYKQEQTMRGPHPLNSQLLFLLVFLLFYPSLCSSASLMYLFGASKISDKGLPSKWSLSRHAHSVLSGLFEYFCEFSPLHTITISQTALFFVHRTM